MLAKVESKRDTEVLKGCDVEGGKVFAQPF